MSTTQGLGEHTVRVSTTVALSRGNLGLYWHQTGKEERIISRFGSTVVEHFWYYHCPLADIDYVPLYSTANKGYMFHYVLWQQIDDDNTPHNDRRIHADAPTISWSSWFLFVANRLLQRLWSRWFLDG
ncbi:uncharacterized protein LOC114264765 isoform X2 [Camellia sinensis]|uniref:uncharacterized protein LOC114264765 isoform X2 n=1 Tax=Camellia sinensis TaxID=4442 RepID=UPI001035CFC1|nr:uncharacterized protein LOC114264765 isoform X2 [Camellia sinensis]